MGRLPDGAGIHVVIGDYRGTNLLICVDFYRGLSSQYGKWISRSILRDPKGRAKSTRVERACTTPFLQGLSLQLPQNSLQAPGHFSEFKKKTERNSKSTSAEHAYVCVSVCLCVCVCVCPCVFTERAGSEVRWESFIQTHFLQLFQALPSLEK